jgi:hypothetical protein
MNNEAKSLQECLTEAAECDRLAGLARSGAARSNDTLRNCMAPSSGKAKWETARAFGNQIDRAAEAAREKARH